MRPELRLLVIPVIMTAVTVPAAADTIRVTIDQLQYGPAAVHASVGDTLTWINKDVVAHTATVRGGWDVMIPAGKSGTLELRKSGHFDYYCRFHPNMTGSVTVEPRAADHR